MRQLILCTLFAGCLLAFGLGEAQAQETRITIAVECGAQGVVDQDWTIEFDLYDAQGKKVNTDPIKVSVPDGTGSAAAADRMAIACDLHAGADAADRQETTHQKYGGDTGKLKAEDVVLKNGYTIKNLKTKKEGKVDCDHLKVFQGKKQLNKRTAKTADHAAALDLLPPAEPLTLELTGYSVQSLGIDLLFGGTSSDGTTYLYEYSQVFDGASMPAEVTAAIAEWAESQGIPVEYPSPSSIRLLFDSSSLQPDWWHFSAYIANGGIDGMTEEVTFNAY